ncbi:MAG: CopD family protein [Arenimonas sp.]
MLYALLKSAHLLFVMAWVAAVFYLPRLLINFAESPGQPDVQARLLVMARRLYLFGHVMFGLAVLFGIGLLHFAGLGGWLHAKLLLVAILFVYFILSYKRLQATQNGKALPSTRTLRILNEVPVFLLFAVIFLVIDKPF